MGTAEGIVELGTSLGETDGKFVGAGVTVITQTQTKYENAFQIHLPSVMTE